MAHYKLYFDGSCGPKNPGGTAAYGFVLLREGQEAPVRTGSGVIGTGPGMTNNLAEFHALGKGLSAFWQEYDPAAHDSLQVFGDSNLVIQIMSRQWKAKSDKAYFRDYQAADGTLRDLRRNRVSVSFDWIPREMNTLCDDLSKEHQKKVA